jgi:hypothetical protein
MRFPGQERAAVRLAQKRLAALGLDPGPIDGLWGGRTQAAYERLRGEGAIANRTRIVQLAQEFLAGQGYQVGAMDGYWGARTNAAYHLWRQGIAPAGTDPEGGQVIAPRWPRDTEADLSAFYGPPGDSHLVMCQPCYPLRLSWEPRTVIRRFACHARVKESLERIFEGIWELYGRDLDRIRAARMDLFSGCYNNRPRKGNLARPSLHARGAAIDLDAEHNQFRWGRDRASMPEEVIDVFAAEGWLSAGRAWGYDFMHFQATHGG